MNTKNSKTSEPHRFKLDLTDKLNLKDPNKNMALVNLTENPPVQINPNKIKKRIDFKIKTGHKIELLTPETMKWLGSTKKDVEKIKMEKLYQHQNLLKLL